MLRGAGHGLRRAGARGLASAVGSTSEQADVIIIGAGHNGLVAAALLARQGLKVEVVEEKNMVGGACKTEYPFSKVPQLAQSTGAYLLGLMPPEIPAALGIQLPLRRRDPHYFLATKGERSLLMGSDREATRAQFLRHFSEADWESQCALDAELAALRSDLAPAWLAEPLALEATAERYVRPSLRRAFVEACQGSLLDYLERFGFRSSLLKAMYATTDNTGLTGGPRTPGSGFNFLAHNMGRLPGSDGTWMVVEGGMGVVTQSFARAAMQAGATIQTGLAASSVLIEGGAAVGIVTANGRERRARAVLANADPLRLRVLAGAGAFPPEFNAWLDKSVRDGQTLKVNLAMRGLPTYRCLPEDHGQFRTTTHLLPSDGDDALAAVEQAAAEAAAGRLPERPPIEVYWHTVVDPGSCGPGGEHSAALFVQGVPHAPAGSSWDAEKAGYEEHLLGLVDEFAPGFSGLVADTFTLSPAGIEAHFGMSRGHIYHLDNHLAFDQRLPYATPLQGLYSCSAGCHPAGSVVGAAGHNAAARVITDLGLRPWWRPAGW